MKNLTLLNVAKGFGMFSLMIVICSLFTVVVLFADQARFNARISHNETFAAECANSAHTMLQCNNAWIATGAFKAEVEPIEWRNFIQDASK